MRIADFKYVFAGKYGRFGRIVYLRLHVELESMRCLSPKC
jgi:hypothetical protein